MKPKKEAWETSRRPLYSGGPLGVLDLWDLWSGELASPWLETHLLGMALCVPALLKVSSPEHSPSQMELILC